MKAVKTSFLFIGTALIATAATFHPVRAADTVTGKMGDYSWAIEYVKTEKSKRKVEDEKRQLVHHYKCMIKHGGKIVRTEDLVSNGNWVDGKIGNVRARKNAASVCEQLTRGTWSK